LRHISNGFSQFLLINPNHHQTLSSQSSSIMLFVTSSSLPKVVLLTYFTATFLSSGLAFSNMMAQAHPSIATRKHHPSPHPVVSSPSLSGNRRTLTRRAAVAVFGPETAVINNNEEHRATTITPTTTNKTPAFMRRVKNYLFPAEWKGLSKKEILARMGGSMVVSFSVIKQVVNAFSFPLGWYLHCSQTGLSPFAPGQWPLFLAINTGLRAVDAATTPIQLALAASASPLFRRMMDACKRKLKMNSGFATFTVMLFANFAAIGALVGNVVLVSIFTGVPIFSR
jgi:hypothetical protein